nr:cysteine-rich KTR domain-containing protein [uncultured Acetatifactor sp.]
MKIEWIHCPVCGNKTRTKLRKDTILKSFPLFCPKCKKESLIDARDLKIEIIKEPDA